jgi:hypothetical protein
MHPAVVINDVNDIIPVVDLWISAVAMPAVPLLGSVHVTTMTSQGEVMSPPALG